MGYISWGELTGPDDGLDGWWWGRRRGDWERSRILMGWENQKFNFGFKFKPIGQTSKSWIIFKPCPEMSLGSLYMSLDFRGNVRTRESTMGAMELEEIPYLTYPPKVPSKCLFSLRINAV